jgi:hypothetical protein
MAEALPGHPPAGTQSKIACKLGRHIGQLCKVWLLTLFAQDPTTVRLYRDQRPGALAPTQHTPPCTPPQKNPPTLPFQETCKKGKGGGLHMECIQSVFT